MGRSSGGSGGHSGGFGGGGSNSGSFGGFSSGSRRSSGRSSGSSSGGFRLGGGGFYGGGGFFRRGRYGFGGGGSAISFIIAIIAIVAMVWSMMPKVTSSTVKREKLDPSQCITSETWYIDDAGWIYDDATLVKGLESFYKATGVQPLLVLPADMEMSKSEVETYLTDLYDKMYDDYGHLIWMYLDHGNGVYEQYYYVGNAAKSVIDNEALHIIKDYIDVNATTDKSDEEFFADSFESAGERIMKKTIPTVVIIGGMFTVIAVVGIVAFAVVRRSKHKKEEAEAAEKILNSDL